MPKKSITIDDLGKKIDRLDQKFEDKINKLDQHLDTLAIISSKGFEVVNKRFDILEKDHQDMMMKLSNVAYRFELVALSKRVEFLEKKLGVSHK